MSLLISNSHDADSTIRAQASVPPLFAGPVKDDLAAKIGAALSAGDHEKAAVLLHEAERSFPNDEAWPALAAQCEKLARRKGQFEAALQSALDELSEDRFASSLGKFREAISLCPGYEMFARKVRDAGATAAETLAGRHWRFAEALLVELGESNGQRAGSDATWETIEKQKREESIRVALEESGRAEHAAYLPHLRERLAALVKAYPQTAPVETRMRVLDGLMAQSLTEDREKNLRRLTLFRDRLDLTDKAETLRGFNDLVAPFVDPYRSDKEFVAVLGEIGDLRSKYDIAVQLLAEDRLQDALLICDGVLRRRPANVLFCALEEKIKGREWVGRLVTSAVQRARAFEEKAQYSEALEEWESLREVDPRYPSLASEILHCAALKQQSEIVRSFQPAPFDETALVPEIVAAEAEPAPVEAVEAEPELIAGQIMGPQPAVDEEQPLALAVRVPMARRAPARFRIVITGEAWNNLKTGAAATLAVLLVVLVFASNGRR